MWEGIVDQHLEKWFGSGENTLFPCHLGEHIEAIKRDLHGIRPTSEIIPKPRKLAERHDWKASEKKALLLYYSIPILVRRPPEKYMQHFMLLVGAIHRLQMQHITKRSGGGTTFFSSFTVQKCQVSTEKGSRRITATASYTLPMMSNSVVPFGHTAVFPLKTLMETSRIFSWDTKHSRPSNLT